MKRPAILTALLFCMLYSASASPLPEKLIWEYEGSNWDWYVKFQMKFDGVSEVDGVEWQRFTQVKCDGYFQGSKTPQNGETGFTYLIREEDGKYFIHKPVNEPGVIPGELIWEMDVECAQLYDFNCKKGDTMCMYTNMGNESEWIVREVNELTTRDGVTRKVLDLHGTGYNPFKAFIIEGLGPAEQGVLPYFQTLLIAASGSTSSIGRWPVLAACTMQLKRVVDENGDAIYEKGMLSGIEAIEADRNSDVQPIVYDLHGNRVDNPQPGSVYIRDGKKFVP